MWTTFAGPAGDPVPLPAAGQHRYWLRVAAGHVDLGDAVDLGDYEADLAAAGADIPEGLERIHIDVSPAG